MRKRRTRTRRMISSQLHLRAKVGFFFNKTKLFYETVALIEGEKGAESGEGVVTGRLMTVPL